MNELPFRVHQRVQELSVQGDAFAEQGNYDAAINKYNEAWLAIPDPKNDWEASTWLLVAVGDACFLGGYFTSGSEAFRYALSCPGGIGNPFVHLRLGQCEFERKELDEAAEHLTRAYMLEGKEILSNDHPKYFEYLKTRIKPPASGEW